MSCWGISTKVFALGGAGGVGRLAARRLLAVSDVVSEIVIASRNLETAKQAATELGDKATALRVDALDEGQVASLATDSDILMNTAGPDFKVALPALHAAIKAGAHYVDVSADGPTTEKALALDGAAKASGVTAVVGIGWMPGLSSLLMMHAAHQLEQVQEVRHCLLFPWAEPQEDPKQVLAKWRKTGHADGSWQQMMRWVAGRVRLYRHGRWLDVDPVKDSVRVAPPHGGEVSAHPVGSAEPITLPRVLPGVQSVSSLWSFLPSQFNELYLELGRRIASGELDESAAALSLHERVAVEPERWLPKGRESRWVEWAEAVGMKTDRRVRYKCWPIVDWASTSGPLAVATLKILRGEVRTRGVLSPESCLDPTSFFEEEVRLVLEKPPAGKLLDESFEVLK